MIRSYLTALVRAMSWKVVRALALMVSLSLMEGIGVLMLVPILQLVGLDMQQGVVSTISRVLASVFALVGVRPTLVTVLVGYVLIISAYALLLRAESIASASLRYEFVAQLRERLYRAITSTNWLFFSRQRASDLTHALTTELDRVGAGTYHLLNLVATAILATVYLLMALGLSAAMTGLVLVCGIALMILLRSGARRSRLAGEGLSATTRGMYAAAIEHLAGMKTVKSYSAEERNNQIFSSLSRRVAQMYISAIQSQADVKWLSTIGSALIISLILYIAIQGINLPAGILILLLLVYARIMPRVSSIQESYQYFVNMLPAFASVTEMQTRCDAAVEPKPALSVPVRLRNSVRFDQVSFTYERHGNSNVISNLSLTMCAGKTTAIVGPSGAGKSTVADLVMGLIVPSEGRVLVDEQPLSAERLRDWRNQIGYVAQETFLLHDTLRANLLWACPNADDDEIRHALRLAAAEGFAYNLPQALETVLGDRGVRLSAGERQRLALARALLRKPMLLTLDEATSNLDSENERRIQNAIDELKGQMTILVITHRLSSIRRADVIHVMEQGRLVESGDWNGLYANTNGRFRALCDAQGATD